MRRALRIAGVIVAVGVVAFAAVLGTSALFYLQEMHIDRTHGVEESGYIRIGDIDQWIQIRGDERANPVLLWLNGGPGFSTISATPLSVSVPRQAMPPYGLSRIGGESCA